MIYKLKQAYRASPLFRGWEETMIWSCLQGVMGHIYVDSFEHPVSAMAYLGDFRFFAGKPNRELTLYGLKAAEAQKYDPAWCIMTPRDAGWAALIEDCYGKRAKKVTRFATKKDPDTFDKKKLVEAVETLPDGYVLRQIGEEQFLRCKNISWCADWVSQYRDFARYQKYGMGVVVERDGAPVSGASSYAGYHGGIEIQIDTAKEYRRRGLGYICGAKLILDCLSKGIYPSWDAQNKASLQLAEKLGYQFAGAYDAYEVEGV